MSRNSAKVTITRRNGSFHGGVVAIAISDEASGIPVCEVEMPLDSFAECITGLAASKGEFRNIASEYAARRYGKKKVVKHVCCEKFYDKDKAREAVKSDFNEKYAGEWELWSDCTKSQQPGEMHQYIICKYVDQCTATQQ